MEGRMHWARAGDAQVAYRRAGAGPPVVFCCGTFSSLAFVDLPTGARYAEAIGHFAQLVAWDPRGIGSSDPRPPEEPPSLDGQVADLLAVLDDAGLDRVWLHGFHSGVAVALAVAAGHPERVDGLCLAHGWARSDYTPQQVEALATAHVEHFGTGMFAEAFCPSRAGDRELRQELAQLEQRSGSRQESKLLNQFALGVDITDLLPQITAPTVVLHSPDNRAIPVRYGREIADGIPGARFVALRSPDHAYPWVDPEPVLEELELLVTGHRPDHGFQRALRTVVFTDVVGSTERAAALGDRAWRALLDRHDEVVRQEVHRCGGAEANTTGDGFLATFDRPGRAVECGQALVAAVAALDLDIRVGVHIGEVELRGDDVAGVAVHVAARIAALATSGEVLVSRTVVDVLAGSTIEFEFRSAQELKGVPRTWELYSVDAS